MIARLWSYLTSLNADVERIRPGDPDPYPSSEGVQTCFAESPTCPGYTCTAPVGHAGQHVAAGYTTVQHVWDADGTALA